MQPDKGLNINSFPNLSCPFFYNSSEALFILTPLKGVPSTDSLPWIAASFETRH